MTKPADYPVTPELTKQVADQCRVVAHMARALAEVYEDYSKMMGDVPAMDELANSTGKRTAHLMEVLGDILNGMDAVTEEDEWCAPIFAEAHRLWPRDREEDLMARVQALTHANTILIDHIAKLHNVTRHAFSAAVEAAADDVFREMSGIKALREARELRAAIAPPAA